MMNGTSKELIGVYANSTPISSIYKGSILIWGLNTESPEVPDIPNFNVDDIVFEVDTSINKTFTLPVKYWDNGSAIPIFTINWGDGTVDNNVDIHSSTGANTTEVSHIYEKEGRYIVIMSSNINSKNRLEFIDDWIDGISPVTKIYSFGNRIYNTVKITSKMKYLTHIGSGIFTGTMSGASFTITNIGTSTSSSNLLAVNLEGVLAKCSKPISFNSCYFTEIKGDIFAGWGDNASGWSDSVFNGGYIRVVDTLSIPTNLANVPIFNSAIRKFRELQLSPSSYIISYIMGTDYRKYPRSIFITNVGVYTGKQTLDFSGFTNWGLPEDSFSFTQDAKDSVVSSLITNSVDKSANPTAQNIKLSKNTLSVLTDEEIAQITSKGYTIL